VLIVVRTALRAAAMAAGREGGFPHDLSCHAFRMEEEVESVSSTDAAQLRLDGASRCTCCWRASGHRSTGCARSMEETSTCAS
jgi:hypothetical protein